MDKPKKKSKGNIFNLDIGNIEIKNPLENFNLELLNSDEPVKNIFGINPPKSKKCERCGVLKKDDSALCEECYKKENRKCEICGKPSGTYPKCRDCYYKNQEMGGSSQDPRAKYPAEYRTESGHYVRSKAEQKIADWFFRQDIKFTYEKKFPEENLNCDFYIEKWDVWIEYWGLENKEYKQNKQRKLDIYAKHKKNLINLFEADIKNNLDNLPQKLRPFIHTPFNFR